MKQLQQTCTKHCTTWSVLRPCFAELYVAAIYKHLNVRKFQHVIFACILEVHDKADNVLCAGMGLLGASRTDS